MKKAISLTLALVMALSLVSCGSKDSDGNSSNTGNNSAGSTGGSSASQSTTDGNYTYSGRLTLGGSDSTGQMYAAAATIATTFSASIDGLDVSATTSSGSNENALNVHDGVVELGMCSGDAAGAARAGTGKFENVGPCEDIVCIGAVYASVSNWIALKDSGYEYLHDAVGGVFGIGPAASTSEDSARLGLKAAGITEENSTFQNVTLGDGADNVANGVMAASTAFSGPPVGAHLNAAVTKDCVWLGFTEEELDTIIAENPAYSRQVIPAGTYPGQDKDVPTFGVKTLVICNADADEELIYHLAKALVDNAEDMIAGNASLAPMASADFICKDLPVPLHPGAEAYYKDAGLL
ncbi:TRAP transporter solute receptor%2C TAXI family [uncultured Flavonifractor sp.]|nr:TRAP transporter solute receptor%2C TAXI family [uncultured Flavonifractor sp.]